MKAQRSALADQQAKASGLLDDAAKVLAEAGLTPDEIEALRRDLPGEGESFSLAAGMVEAGQIDHQLRQDLLDRGAVDLAKGGAQHLVAAHDLVEAAGERRPVERPDEAQEHPQVVGRASRGELIQEPHPLLGKRQRSGPGIGAPVDREGCRRSCFAAAPLFQQGALGGGQAGQTCCNLVAFHPTTPD